MKTTLKFITFKGQENNTRHGNMLLSNFAAEMEKIFHFLGPLKILKKISARKVKKCNIIEYGNCNYNRNYQFSNQLIAVGSC